MRKWLSLQLVTIAAVTVFYGVMFTIGHMLAALVGLFIAMVPNAIFLWFGHRYQGASNAQQIVGSFYRGESVKFILTAILFAVAFMAIDGLYAIHIIIGFVIGVIVGWVGSTRL